MQLVLFLKSTVALLAAWQVVTPESGKEILLEDRRGTPIPVTPFPAPTPGATITPGPSPTPMKIARGGSFEKKDSVCLNK